MKILNENGQIVRVFPCRKPFYASRVVCWLGATSNKKKYCQLLEESLLGMLDDHGIDPREIIFQ